MERVLAFECKFGTIRYRRPTIREGYLLGEQYSDLPEKFKKFNTVSEDDSAGNIEKIKLISQVTNRIYQTLLDHKFIVGCELIVGEDNIDKVEMIDNYLELKDEISTLCFSFIGLVFGIDLKKNT